MLCALWSFSTNAVSLALLFRAPVVKGGLARTACQNTVLKEIWCCDTMVWFLLSSLFHFWQRSMSLRDWQRSDSTWNSKRNDNLIPRWQGLALPEIFCTGLWHVRHIRTMCFKESMQLFNKTLVLIDFAPSSARVRNCQSWHLQVFDLGQAFPKNRSAFPKNPPISPPNPPPSCPRCVLARDERSRGCTARSLLAAQQSP